MKSTKYLFAGFLSIILLTIVLGFTSIYKLIGLGDITQKMYNHPFSVSKAILQIKIQTTQIQYDMQVLTSLNGISKIHEATMDMNKHYLIADENYKLIFERYLGDTKDIKSSYEIFLKWKELRDDIVVSLINKDSFTTQKLRKTEMLHQAKINKLLTKLEDFAHNKALTYKQVAQDSKIDAVIIILVLLILIGITSTIIATIIIRNITNSTQEMQRYFHIIEQNVNIAHLNADTSINEISHSLARLLQTSKEEIMKLKTNPLFGTNEQQISQIMKTIKSSEPYHGEVAIQDTQKKNLWLNVDIQPSLDSSFKIIGYTMILQDITNKKLLEVVSKTDGMTGLFNRREFDNTFEKRLNLAKREKKTLVFIMIDIDYFKLYNDNYGHQAGDYALKSVARALKAIFTRPDDIVYRLGGEEFGVVFSTLNQEGAIIMAEKILARVQKMDITHDFSSVGNFVSVSLGVGIIKADSPNSLFPETIYDEVDKALCKAKENGRNRYELVSIS